MNLEFPKPEKTMRFLKEFEKKKEFLNSYTNNENLKNFLQNNNIKSEVPQSKIRVLLHNFDENNPFKFLDENKREAFKLLERSKGEYSLPQDKLCKLLLYFYGFVPIEDLNRLLFNLSDKSVAELNFGTFVESNISQLFNKKSFNFPKELLGEYPLLKELIPIIKKDKNFLKKIEYWEENILGYIFEEGDDKIIEEISEIILKNINGSVSDFFKKNKNVKIKSIKIKYKNINKKLYKIIEIQLIKDDTIVFALNYEDIKKRTLFSHKEEHFFYFPRKKEDMELRFNVESKFTNFSLFDALKNRYSLNKLYSFKMKLKRVIGKLFRK